MSLSSLPAELKLVVVNHLDPESTLNFALSIKTHYVLCQDRLQEHARLFAKYSVIRPSNDGYLIWDITKEVLQDPRKGWYVRELDLVNDRPGQNPNLPEEDKAMFKAAVDEILPWYPYFTDFFDVEHSDAGDVDDDIDDDIDGGFEAPMLVLLVHHIPRLRSFRMTVHHMSDTFLRFMRRVAANYQDASLARQMPLQHLRLAAIAHDDIEGCCSVDWAVYFMCIPSLKIFAAFVMGSEHIYHLWGENSEDHLRYFRRPPVSNVEELYFRSCQFDPDSFDTLLPMTKNLRKFLYEAGGPTVTDQDYEPRKVIRALIRHAGHSLEELHLSKAAAGFEHGEDNAYSISARGFKKLKALSCEMRWLLRKPEDPEKESEDAESQEDWEAPDEHDIIGYPGEECFVSSNNPRDNLPASLEYLYLNDFYSDEEYKQMIEVFKTTNTNTPGLTLESVCIDRYDGSRYGHAVKPRIRFANPLLEGIWSGHNVKL